jgi:hypothetical protein
MQLKKSNQEIWQRELALAQRPEIWKSFAIETRLCAEFLLDKYETKLISDESREMFRAFFAYKYIRMLMGYSLENLIKGLLLSSEQKGKFIKENRISFGTKGHDLLWLLDELGITLADDVDFYVKAWSISAEWFGKYPFPLEMNRVLDEYQSLPSSEALLRRTSRGKRKFIHNDLLHQGIGTTEWKIFSELFSRILAIYK